MRYALTFLLMATVALGQGVWPKTATVVDGGHRYDFDTDGKRSIMPESIFADCVLWQAFSYSDNSDADFYTLSRNASGDGAQGTAAAQPTFGSTDGGTYDFDGVDDTIDIDSVLTPLASTTAGSWVAWVNWDSSNGRILSFGDTSASEWFTINAEISGIITFACRIAGTWKWAVDTDSAAITSGQWAHVAGVQDGTEAKIYVDGVEPAQTFFLSGDKTAWFSDQSGLDNGRIGAISHSAGGNSSFWNGDLDDVRIYDRALTAAEVGVIYTNTAPTYGITP